MSAGTPVEATTGGWFSLTGLLALRACAGLQFGSIAAVASLLEEELHLSGAELGALVGLYTAPAILLAIPGASWARRFGDTRVLTAALMAMTAGSLLTALAGGFGLAMLGRLVAGCGGVIVQMVVTRMVADRFAGPRSSVAVGTILASWPVGLLVSLMILGPLAQALGWRVALALAAAAPAFFILRRGWSHASSPPGPLRSAPLFNFTRREWTVVLLIGLAYLAYNGGSSSYVAFVPVLLAERGEAVGEAAVFTSIAALTMVLVTPFGGLVADRSGRPRAVVVAGAFIAVASILATSAMSSPVLALAVAGAMIALPPGPLGALLSRSVSPAGRPGAFAMFSIMASVGTLIAPPLAGWMRDMGGSAEWALASAALLLGITGVLALWIRPDPPR